MDFWQTKSIASLQQVSNTTKGSWLQAERCLLCPRDGGPSWSSLVGKHMNRVSTLQSRHSPAESWRRDVWLIPSLLLSRNRNIGRVGANFSLATAKKVVRHCLISTGGSILIRKWLGKTLCGITQDISPRQCACGHVQYQKKTYKTEKSEVGFIAKFAHGQVDSLGSLGSFLLFFLWCFRRHKTVVLNRPHKTSPATEAAIRDSASISICHWARNSQQFINFFKMLWT